MFGSKNSGQLRWFLAALAFVWAAAIAGNASAGNKVTICHFPPGNPSNYQQISIDAAGVPAHLAHGDFLGSCASDCNLNQTLCSTPPDSCHQAGTCVASTGLRQFPLQPDGMACTGNERVAMRFVSDGACIAVSSCPQTVNGFANPPGEYDTCSPDDGGTCIEEATNCGNLPDSSVSTVTNPPTGCFATSVLNNLCVESCNFTVCGDGSPTTCGNAVGCLTNIDCPLKHRRHRPAQQCVTFHAARVLGTILYMDEYQLPAGDLCDPITAVIHLRRRRREQGISLGSRRATDEALVGTAAL